jgi:hypothetical protein
MNSTFFFSHRHGAHRHKSAVDSAHQRCQHFVAGLFLYPAFLAGYTHLGVIPANASHLHVRRAIFASLSHHSWGPEASRAEDPWLGLLRILRVGARWKPVGGYWFTGVVEFSFFFNFGPIVRLFIPCQRVVVQLHPFANRYRLCLRCLPCLNAMHACI